MTPLLAFAAAASFATDAPAQEIVRQWFGDGPGQQFGSPIGWVGDVNADGFMDIGVAAPRDSTVLQYAGMLRVISGKDGTVLHTLYGDAAGAELGTFGLGHPIGDLDRDGFDDVLVSERYGGTWPYVIRIFVFSGKDGSELRKLTGNSTLELSGPTCGTGDVDGDGVPDFAATGYDPVASASIVAIISGATSAVIRTLTPFDPTSGYFGHALLNPGDIDGDGVNDLIVIENGCYYASQMNYYAFSGRTGATIWRTPTNTNCQITSGGISTALSPVVIGDINGDGIPDWADGQNAWWWPGTTSGTVFCHSGKDGSPLFWVAHPFGTDYSYYHVGSSFGEAITPAGDVNGDGVPDFAASDDSFSDDPGGNVFFFSGADGKMLFHCHGPASAATFGKAIAGGFDSDGDSKLDMFVGDDSDSSNGFLAGSASQLHIEPITLDVLPRHNPYSSTLARVSGGVPGNPVAIFLAVVNGGITFTLLDFGTFDPARRFDNVWNVPSGLTGISAQVVAFTVLANGHIQASNFETITFP